MPPSHCPHCGIQREVLASTARLSQGLTACFARRTRGTAQSNAVDSGALPCSMQGSAASGGGKGHLGEGLRLRSILEPAGNCGHGVVPGLRICRALTPSAGRTDQAQLVKPSQPSFLAYISEHGNLSMDVRPALSALERLFTAGAAWHQAVLEGSPLSGRPARALCTLPGRAPRLLRWLRA